MYTQSFRAEKAGYFKKYRTRDSLDRKAYFEGQRKTSVQDAVYLMDIFRNLEVLRGIELWADVSFRCAEEPVGLLFSTYPLERILANYHLMHEADISKMVDLIRTEIPSILVFGT